MSITKTEVEKSLDVIYSRCTAEQQKSLQPEFDLIRQFICDKTPKEEDASKSIGRNDCEYLNGLSEEAKNLVIGLIDKGEKNLYHSIMAVIDGQRHKNQNASLESIKHYYKKRFERRDYIQNNWHLVSEIFNLCWNRYIAK